jgi:hypothetical protein
VNLNWAKGLSIPEPYYGGGGFEAPEPGSQDGWVPYAVIEYENMLVPAEACYYIKRQTGSGVLWNGAFLFEVSKFSELTVYLLARYSDGSAAGSYPLGLSVSTHFWKAGPLVRSGYLCKMALGHCHLRCPIPRRT